MGSLLSAVMFYKQIMMANSQKVFGCCNVFDLAKGLNIAEIFFVVECLVLSFILIGTGFYEIYLIPLGIVNLIVISYLVTELIGIHTKNQCLIIFGCVIRTLKTISMITLIIRYSYFFQCFNEGCVSSIMTILLAIIFCDLALLRTYVQFKAFFTLRKSQQQNDEMVITPGHPASTKIPMFCDVQSLPSLSVLSNYSQNNETKEDWDQNPPSYYSITHNI